MTPIYDRPESAQAERPANSSASGKSIHISEAVARLIAKWGTPDAQ